VAVDPIVLVVILLALLVCLMIGVTAHSIWQDWRESRSQDRNNSP
jgi:hypothetical protein